MNREHLKQMADAFTPSPSFPIQSIIRHFELPDRETHELVQLYFREMQGDSSMSIDDYRTLLEKVFSHLPACQPVTKLIHRELYKHRGMEFDEELFS
jgi:hypothetical protein